MINFCIGLDITNIKRVYENVYEPPDPIQTESILTSKYWYVLLPTIELLHYLLHSQYIILGLSITSSTEFSRISFPVKYT